MKGWTQNKGNSPSILFPEVIKRYHIQDNRLPGGFRDSQRHPWTLSRYISQHVDRLSGYDRVYGKCTWVSSKECDEDEQAGARKGEG